MKRGGRDLEKLFKEFIIFLDNENKQKAVELVLKYLSDIKTDKELVDLYVQVLKRSLDEMTCSVKDNNICIWKEHVRTSIIRTILECAYPYVIKLWKANHKGEHKGKVVVICPDGEYHEIGARMVSDYFTLLGYESIYVGSSTPKEEFIHAINDIKPHILALSVTNYYNLVSAKKTIEIVREKVDYPLKIVVGGNAFISNPKSFCCIGADKLLNSYEEILDYTKEVN